MKRWILVTCFLLVLFLLPFVFFEDYFNTLFSQAGIEDWLERFKTFGLLGGILLLAADIFLPLPGTLIISTLGYVYGPLTGGVAATVGLILSGTIAYFLCRYAGVGVTKRLLGEEAYVKGQQFSAASGGWVVAMSRWLPLLSEIVACMAGLTKMPPRIYFIALICGAAPFGFLFAYIGHTGHGNPALTIALNIVVPALLWLIAGRLIYNRSKTG